MRLLSSICPAESAEGDAEDVPAENPGERERSSAAERDGGVSEGESREEETFVSVQSVVVSNEVKLLVTVLKYIFQVSVLYWSGFILSNFYFLLHSKA